MKDASSPPRYTEDTLEATVEVGQSTPQKEWANGGFSRHCGCVSFVTGSTPEITCELEGLLRRRLRLAAILLFVGFTVFLVWHVARFGLHLEEILGPGFFLLHIGVTAVLGVIAALLCRHCVLSIFVLRVCEWLIFGLPALFFLAAQYEAAAELAHRGHLMLEVGPWLVLMLTYALFIPNTVWRAALVLGLMAAMPMGLLLLLSLTAPQAAALISLDHVVRLGLLVGCTAIAGVLGVDTIGTLRREAFEAKQVGQYRLRKRLGSGGMGEVYLAEHQLLKRPCVVKLIRPDKAGDPRVLARFQREVQATAQLSHWNTVEIFDYGITADGTFYYVMEYLPGMNLSELVARYGPMPPERVIYLLRQACDALREAHAAGLVHRDIKPANIFAAQRGGVYDVVKLLDFGLVKPLADKASVELSMEGAITGSPLYMSPEQGLGDGDVDGRSDIYSLGAVGYYLLTGRPPFEGDRPIKVILAHAHEEVTPPSRLRPEVPGDLEQVILRALAKRPEDRYPDVESFSEALGQCEAAGRWSREEAARWWESVAQGQSAHAPAVA